jgi:hypothetical protein
MFDWNTMKQSDDHPQRTTPRTLGTLALIILVFVAIIVVSSFGLKACVGEEVFKRNEPSSSH